MTKITKVQADEFNAAVETATDKLNVIKDWKRSGVRYEGICFDGEDLVIVSGKSPLKAGEQIKPRGVTVRKSVEWASFCAASGDRGELDAGSNSLAEAKWFALIEEHLRAYGAP